MINQANNLHPLYIEQQQWFAQFQQTQQQQQQPFQQLQCMGFNDHRKNYRLLKRYNWNVDSVAQALSHKSETRKPETQIDIIQIITNTKILYIDCNNIKYACNQWNKFRGKPKKQIKTIFKIIMKWLLQQDQKLEEVHLIWDVYKMHKIAKLKQQLTSKQMFKEISEMKEEPNKLIFKSENVQFTIQSAYPGIADDLIVELSSQHQDNGQTTVVTSDRGLKQRLEEKGVTQFIGNGKWWKLKDEMLIQ